MDFIKNYFFTNIPGSTTSWRRRDFNSAVHSNFRYRKRRSTQDQEDIQKRLPEALNKNKLWICLCDSTRCNPTAIKFSRVVRIDATRLDPTGNQFTSRRIAFTAFVLNARCNNTEGTQASRGYFSQVTNTADVTRMRHAHIVYRCGQRTNVKVFIKTEIFASSSTQ